VKRLLAATSVLALLAAPAVADAAVKKAPKPTKRTVTWNYTGVFGAYVSAAGGGGVCGANPEACYDLATQVHETKVTFTATDATGQKVPVQYTLDGDYDGNTLQCSTGDVAVRKGTVVNFYMVATDACPGVPTQGTITMTITGKK
jgi:hypothetical protein